MADSNKIKYGLSKCYYAVATIASDGSATYDTPVAMPGAVSMSLAAQGEVNKFYADNIVYFTSAANNGYEGDLELAKLPETFLTDVLGFAKATNDVVYEDADAAPVHFALLFEFDGDDKKTRHVLYNCTATRPAVGSATKAESVEPQTESITITASTIYVSAITKNVPKGYLVEGDTGYSTFFSAVVQPSA